MPADLVLMRPGGEDRPPLEVTVCRQAGGWTPAPYVAVEAGNVIELTADELLWLIQAAGPWALDRLRELQAGGQPRQDGPSPPSAAAPGGERPVGGRSPIDDPSVARPGSSVAGQGDPDPRPAPAQSSTEEAS